MSSRRQLGLGRARGLRALPALSVLAMLAMAVAVPAAPVGAAQPKLPTDFVGVTSEEALTASPVEQARIFRDQAAAGVRLVRQQFNWAHIERTPGLYQLQEYDRFVAEAARNHIRVMPVLFDPPQPRERSPATGRFPPRSFREMVTFAQVLWVRYGPDGSLWRQLPDLPKLPMRSWQVWNEPNLRKYWPRDPKASDYGRMLRQVGGILNGIDSNAEIVTGGLAASRSKGSIPLVSYLRGLDRGSVPFDTLAVHGYASTTRELMRNLRAVRSVLDRSGRRRTRIWITELGWSDTGPRSRFRLGRRGQARMIARTLRAIERERDELRIRGVVYQSWRDGRPYAPSFRDFWGLHTGLLRVDGQPKPAFWSFSRTVKRLRWSQR